MPRIYVRMPTLERFWGHVEIAASGCWEWTAALSQSHGTKSYGVFWDGEKLQVVHRFLYEILNGIVPKGFELHHLCRNKRCLNPNHLEIVTRSENMRRESPLYLFGTCSKGHLLSGDKIYWRKDRPGTWNCVRCSRERLIRWRASKV